MAYTIAAAVEAKLTGTQTFTGEQVSSGNNDVAINGLDLEATYNASSSPPITTVGHGTITLAAGVGSIDLTAFSGTNGNESASGLKVQFIKFVAPSSNANVITIAEGASNGYALLGASFTFELLPGQWAMFGQIGRAHV